MKTIRLVQFCAGQVLRIAYGQAVYEFTVGQNREVPAILADRLLEVHRPCGFGVFEEVA